MVPHGYAVAQVSVFGTGMSNHCMDFMGLSEQMGIDAAVTWLGTQEWSNGNVGIVGKSYDGTTLGKLQCSVIHIENYNPNFWLIKVHDLMWRRINGSKRFSNAQWSLGHLDGMETAKIGKLCVRVC